MKYRLVWALIVCAGVSIPSALGLPKGFPKGAAKGAQKGSADAAALAEAAQQEALMHKPLPVFSTYDDAALNRFDSLEYAAKLAKWNALPYEFEKYQVVQIVVPNDELQAYESRMITVGKTGSDACLTAAKAELDQLPAALKSRASVRCLASSEEIGPADEDTDDPELYEFYESKEDLNLVSQTFSELKNLYAGLNAGSGNVYRKDRKYDFKKGGYLVSAQRLPTNFSKVTPPASKAEDKPEFSHYEFANATVKGGVVCGFEYQVGDPAFYDDSATVGQVGYGTGDPDFPKCYKLAAGSPVYAQKFSQPFGVQTYRVSYYLQRGDSHFQTEGTTLPENVVFNAKKKVSAFKK